MSNLAHRAGDLAIAATLLLVTGVGATTVARSIYGRAHSRVVEKPALVGAWRSIADSGNIMGEQAAVVRIVELSDFQCPFCSREAGTLAMLRRRYGTAVSVTFRHFPLSGIHPHARAAAVASECAGEQGRFEAYHDILFGTQDSIGVWSWWDFARRAGVRDSAAFNRCRTAGMAEARVDRDIAVGHALGVNATPTVIVQGLRLPGTPSYETLDSLVRLVRQGTPLTAP